MGRGPVGHRVVIGNSKLELGRQGDEKVGRMDNENPASGVSFPTQAIRELKGTFPGHPRKTAGVTISENSTW